jgi:hypothetical protein
MYGMFLLGFGFAVGHHAFYNHLDGRPADDQIRMMRFGGLLSYAAKASLLAAVIYAYRQQIWVTAINNTLRLRTIDSLFSAVNEPLALWNWEFIKKARIAVCLAVLAWWVAFVIVSISRSPLTIPGFSPLLSFSPPLPSPWRRTTKLRRICAPGSARSTLTARSPRTGERPTGLTVTA